MAKLHQIFQRLKSTPGQGIDLAIAQAMPTADLGSLSMMAKTLLERKQGLGLVALVEQYHRLPKDLQENILHRVPDLTRALRRVIGNKHAQGQANTIHLIRRAMATRQAYLIAEQLRKGRDELKDESARCLLEMAEKTAPDPTAGTGKHSQVDPT
jgi:hypothetical protein